MGRFFDTKEEADRMLDEVTDPDMPNERKVSVIQGAASAPGGGDQVVTLLSLRCAAAALEECFGGNTGNEIHDMRTSTLAREPLAQLNLAITKVMEAAKEIGWNAEICQCHECQHNDKARAAKFN